MNASLPMLAAFEAWKCAELATHFAEPCPDEVMDHLTDAAAAAFADLQAIPAETADEMLLKLYPILLRELEPSKGAPPLRLGYSLSNGYDDAFYDRLNADFSRVSPPLASAAETKARHGAGGAA